MPVEDGKVGRDKMCGDINVFEFSVREGEGRRSGSGGVDAATVFDDAFEENFNSSDDLLMALRWGQTSALMAVLGG